MLTKNLWPAIMAGYCLLIAPNIAAAGNMHLKPVPFSELPGWSQGQQASSIAAMQQSCKRMLHSQAHHHKWLTFCHAVNDRTNISNWQARRLFERYLQAYRVTSDKDSDGLFTGYYQPVIKGSLKPTDYYRVPLYGKPKNLTHVKISGRYHYRLHRAGHYALVPERASISKGGLLPRTPVIAWIHSKVDRFFLQIQGSGSIELPSGKKIILGYAGENSRPYYPIGKYLVEKGYIASSNISMQSIRKWLYQHPSKAQYVMNLNRSFVFFRRIAAKHPIGAEGVPLTPGFSLAVDPKYINYGTPVWLSTHLPRQTGNRIIAGKGLQRLLIAQDTGGAITNPVRGDIFWGTGERAKWLAGHMQSPGKMWILLPKP